MSAPVRVTELVLRDAHQSLLATRLRIEDMLPVAEALDRAGYWSLEVWGGATFDACIRFLGEDPFERLRRLKAAMPNTPLQMLLRGQNLLGYRHYADDVVRRFVGRSAECGMDVFRIFDALNDPWNLETAVAATLEVGKHAQGTLSYTTSPVHTLDSWITLGRRLADMGCDSLCIKDMAGLLKPYDAVELIEGLKAEAKLPISLHAHATTGLSTATLLKAVEAGVDVIDTAISSMSLGTGHTATETMVAALEGTERATGLDLVHLEGIAAHFREVRKRYARFEGSLKGVDGRILTAQVPGGMLTNLENQLRQQKAQDKFDRVLEEIPRVREDLGYLPLVTPTSQIVGTQAVLNVLAGSPYKSLTRETAGVLRGEYGRTPAPVNAELERRALDGDPKVEGRPSERLAPELDRLESELLAAAAEKGLSLSDERIDDVLIYALFPQVGLQFLQHRNDPGAFEPVPRAEEEAPGAPPAARPPQPAPAADPESYRVTVEGKTYEVEVEANGALRTARPQAAGSAERPSPPPPRPRPAAGRTLEAPLTGTITRILVKPGEPVTAGTAVLALEAMKMETEVPTPVHGLVGEILVRVGDAVEAGQPLLSIQEEGARDALV